MDVRMGCACGHELSIDYVDAPVVEHFFNIFHAEHAHNDDRAMTAAATPMSATVIHATEEDDGETT